MKKISYNDLGCGRKLKIGHNCGVANAWGKEYFCTECKSIEKALWRKDSERNREKREKYLKSKGGNK